MDVALPILQIGQEQAFDHDTVVYIAVKYLAGNCDGAARRDDVGYNRLHAGLGHKLADIPFRQWTERQAWAARKMLETYKNTQLAFLWHLMPDLPPEPPKNPYDAATDARYLEWKRQRDPSWTPPKPYRRISLYERSGSQYVRLDQNYDRRLIDEIKYLPQSRYVDETDQGTRPGDKFWIVPIHLDTLEAVTEFAVGNGYDIPADVEAAMVAAIEEYTARLALSHASASDFHLDLPPGLELYPFQKAGVQFALRVGNTLIGDEMGLGKTVQGLCTALLTQKFPIVVVCPASLKQNWRREAKKWLPGKTVGVLDSKVVGPLTWEDGTPALDVVIVNYDILGKWLPYLVKFLDGRIEHATTHSGDRGRQVPYDGGVGTLIVDEAHKVKNPAAQRTKNVDALITACQRTHALFLTGTPLMNRPMELWTLIDMLGYGRQFGGYMEFKRRYADPYIPDLEELNTRLRMIMVRRLKSQVLTELPEKQRTVVPLDIDNRAAYEKAEYDVAAYFAKKHADKEMTDLTLQEVQIDAMRQGLVGEDAVAWIKNEMRARHADVFHARYRIAQNNEQLLRWEALKQLAVDGKLSAVKQWIADFVENGRPLIVFAVHTKIVKGIAEHFGWPHVTGDMGMQERDAAVQRFLNDPDCLGIVGNMQAMGEGLTLHRAHTDNPCSDAVFVEYGWNPAAHDQAEDRIHRIGQRDAVNVWNLAAEGTIDYELAELIEAKRAVVTATSDGAGKNLQEEMMDELRQRLQLRLQGRR